MTQSALSPDKDNNVISISYGLHGYTMFAQHKPRPSVWHGRQEVHQPSFLRKGWFTQRGLPWLLGMLMR
jgi:hypothetical protein